MTDRVASAIARRAAWSGLCAFVAIVALEHLLSPGLDPATHQVSEYVHEPCGVIALAGFVAWAVSLAATSVCVRSRGVLAIPLAVAAAGMLVVAVFPTQTVAGALPPGHHLTTTGALHDAGSGATTVALLVAMLLATWRVERLRVLSAGLALVAVAVQIGLLAVGPEVGGIRQRLLLGIGCAWQGALLVRTRRL